MLVVKTIKSYNNICILRHEFEPAMLFFFYACVSLHYVCLDAFWSFYDNVNISSLFLIKNIIERDHIFDTLLDIKYTYSKHACLGMLM
jgi:hypothetical protein